MKHKEYVKKGTYLLADPGLIVNKYHNKGNQFLDELWAKFYHHPKRLQSLKIKRIKFLIWKTPDDDGIYDGVATQSQTLMLLNRKYLDRDIFTKKYNQKFIKTIEILEDCYIINVHDDLMIESLDLKHRKKLI